MTQFIFLLIFLSVLLDRYVYVRRMKKSNTKTKVLYFSTLTLIYVSMLATRLFHIAEMSDLLWLLFAFFMQIFSKLAYFLVSVWGYLCPRYNNRGGIFDTFGILAALIVLFVISWGSFYVRNHPRIEYVDVQSARLPEVFDGYKIAFFSDLHVGSLPENNKLIEKLVQTLNSSGADMVAFGGDLVNIVPEELDSTRVGLLSSIEPEVYSVLGNHDLGIYRKDPTGQDTEAKVTERMIALQQSMGWTLLQNQTTYLYKGGDSISLTGVIFPEVGMNSAKGRQSVKCDISSAYDSVPSSIFNVNISHTPESWPALAGLDGRADLTLSGHVHAMQSKMVIAGKVISPASLLYKFVSGLYRSSENIDDDDLEKARSQAPYLNVEPYQILEKNLKVDGFDKLLYINDGFGYVLLPTRIGCAPEVTILTLRRVD